MPIIIPRLIGMQWTDPSELHQCGAYETHLHMIVMNTDMRGSVCPQCLSSIQASTPATRT